MHALTLITALTPGTALAQTVNFDNMKRGSPIPGWTARLTLAKSASGPKPPA